MESAPLEEELLQIGPIQHSLNIEDLASREGLMRLLIRLSSAVAMATLLLAAAGRVRAAELRVEAAVTRSSITATVSDELGQAAPGAVISFQLPAQGASGLFPNGLRTEIVVAGSDGRAAVSGVRWDDGAGPIAIRVTASKAGARAATVVEWRAGSAVSPPSMSPREGVSQPAQSGITEQKITQKSSPESDTAVPVYHGGSGWGKRLLLIAAIAGGAAAGGFVATSRRGTAGLPAASASDVVVPPSLSVGAPIITVGKP